MTSSKLCIFVLYVLCTYDLIVSLLTIVLFFLFLFNNSPTPSLNYFLSRQDILRFVLLFLCLAVIAVVLYILVDVSVFSEMSSFVIVLFLEVLISNSFFSLAVALFNRVVFVLFIIM